MNVTEPEGVPVEPEVSGHSAVPGHTASGLMFSLIAAFSFATSGTLAAGLLQGGWSPTLSVAIRALVGALALLIPTVLALRGRWGLLRENARLIVLYGLLAVALPQLCYFVAVQYIPVGPAILLEYISPVVVIGWLWLTHGQRPTWLTVVGAVVAMAGLLAVIGVVGDIKLDPIGVLWALGGTLGATSFFLLSSTPTRLPPMSLAGGGLLVGAAVLWLVGLTPIFPLVVGSDAVRYGGVAVPAWAALLALGLVSAALAYSAGIAATRRLGSRLASFVGLLEVIVAFLYAWALLGQTPGPWQVIGAGLILGGVVLVKLGEPS